MMLQRKESFLKYVRETALPGLKNGNAVYGSTLQCVFLNYPRETALQAEIAEAYEALLKKVSAKKLIRISEDYRIRRDEWFLDLDEVNWWCRKPRREDYPHLTVNQYHAVLKFGTFLAGGYDRQWCMEALDGARGSLPFFILRLNDWVGVIRESAFALAKKRLAQADVEELFYALPMLEKVAMSGRRNGGHVEWLAAGVRERSYKIFKEMPEGLLIGRLPYYGVNVKNAVYRLISKTKLLSLTQMERLLSAERTGYGKRLLLEGIFSHYGYDRERVEGYLASRNTLVRHRALWFRYGHDKNAWEGLERMLLDRSRRIRRDAAFILQKHTDIRILDYYLQELQLGVSETVLLGIGEHGTRRELGLIEPFLAGDGSRMAKAALVSYGRLAAEQGHRVYWEFLFDERPAVAKTAYCLIRKNRIHYGAGEIYGMLGKYKGTVTGKYLFQLLLCEPSWERLPFLLEMYAGWELTQEEEWWVREGIGGRYVYAVISKAQAEKIAAVLERGGDKFPERLKKAILFDLEHVVKR